MSYDSLDLIHSQKVLFLACCINIKKNKTQTDWCVDIIYKNNLNSFTIITSFLCRIVFKKNWFFNIQTNTHTRIQGVKNQSSCCLICVGFSVPQNVMWWKKTLLTLMVCCALELPSSEFQKTFSFIYVSFVAWFPSRSQISLSYFICYSTYTHHLCFCAGFCVSLCLIITFQNLIISFFYHNMFIPLLVFFILINTQRITMH